MSKIYLHSYPKPKRGVATPEASLVPQLSPVSHDTSIDQSRASEDGLHKQYQLCHPRSTLQPIYIVTKKKFKP